MNENIKCQIEKLCPKQGDLLLFYFSVDTSKDDVKKLQAISADLIKKLRVSILLLPENMHVEKLSDDQRAKFLKALNTSSK